MDSVGSIIIYFILALALIVFSVAAVTTRKILRSATYLLFTLFAAAGVYFMLDYEFLGTVQIAVYAGGIVVLFVFSILLTHQPGEDAPLLASKGRALGILAAVLMLCAGLWSLLTRINLVADKLPQMSNPDMKLIGEAMLSTGDGGYLLPFEAISVLLLACIIGGVVVARKR